MGFHEKLSRIGEMGHTESQQVSTFVTHFGFVKNAISIVNVVIASIH